jgi:hypothetical protein
MDKIRNTMFTSSQIGNLLTNDKKGGLGAPALKYIAKKRATKILVISEGEVLTTQIAWGMALESYVSNFLFDYGFVSSKTIVHESNKFCGTPDLINSSCVGDIKCPSSPLNILSLFDICKEKSIEKFKDNEPIYYWQLISNSILCNVDFAEIIAFVPCISEYKKVIEHIENIDNIKLQNKLQFVIYEDPEKLPFLKMDCEFKNLNRFKFEVPKEDKELLLKRIDLAYDLLTK